MHVYIGQTVRLCAPVSRTESPYTWIVRGLRDLINIYKYGGFMRYIYIHIYICIHIYVNIYIDIYMYVYIHIHMYIYICIYIHT